MIKEALYNLVIKADKEAKNNGECNYCFCYLVVCCLKDFNLKYSFLDWKAKNNIYSFSCSSVLFYLEDLGIIKILQGVDNRKSGVDCLKLEIKVLRKGNKI